MGRNSPILNTGQGVAKMPSPTRARRLSDSAWEEKWQGMVEHQRNRREQDAILRQKLREKEEMEDYIECTFTPKTHCNYKSRETEELLKLMNPLISEEERILKELRNIEASEEENVQKLSTELRTYIVANQEGMEEDLVRICERYREERLKEMASVKNRKLDIVGLLHDVERRFNIICARERLSEDEMTRTGFNIETCRRIKKEILDSVKGVDTLKDRSKVTSEIETIIKKAKEDAEKQRMYFQQRGGMYIPKPVDGRIPMGKNTVMIPMGKQCPYPMVNGVAPGFVPMFQGGKVPNGMFPPRMMTVHPMHVPQNANPATGASQMNAQASQAYPAGPVPMNPQFGYANGPMPNQPTQMFQRNIPRKLRQ